MDLKSFISAIAQIAEERGIPQDKVIEGIEKALASAYKRDYGDKGQIIKAKVDPKTGKAEFWRIKEVVDKKQVYLEEPSSVKVSEEGEDVEEKEEKVRFNPERHIFVEEAKKIKPKIKVGEELEIKLEPKEEFGRIAAQTAKQVILQQMRETQKEVNFKEYKEKEGEVISGIVQRTVGEKVFFDIGKTMGILPPEEQIIGEEYKQGKRFRLYILKVENTAKGPLVFLSRAYPKIVSKLFEIEVPEISSGQVTVKSIAREPGSRTKIAVASEDEKIDPIGAVVGQRGTRVMAVMSELGGEKIDVIQWSEKPEEFIAKSLAPAKVLEVELLSKNKAKVLVPKDQLSLAIGKDGQNVRLAAILTGWKIDIEAQEEKELEDKED